MGPLSYQKNDLGHHRADDPEPDEGHAAELEPMTETASHKDSDGARKAKPVCQRQAHLCFKW